MARGQQLYRMEFARGAPQGKLESLGSIKNRRGTKVRFKPDEKIFGKGAAFKPARLLRMARSKAYLFGGVEIRWFCAPELIKDDTPAEAVFHFPGGLKEYLEAHASTARRLRHQGSSSPAASKREGGHGSVEWAVAWIADEDGFSSLLLQHHPDGRGRHARERPPHGARQGPARLRRARRQQARRADHRRRRAGHGRRHAVGVHPRARVPGPDQGQARHAGSHPHRRERPCATPSTTGWPTARSRRPSCSNGPSIRPRSG